MDGSNQPNSKSVSHVRNRKRQKIVTQFARDETSDPYQTSRNESAGLKIPKKKKREKNRMSTLWCRAAVRVNLSIKRGH